MTRALPTAARDWFRLFAPPSIPVTHRDITVCDGEDYPGACRDDGTFCVPVVALDCPSWLCVPAHTVAWMDHRSSVFLADADLECGGSAPADEPPLTELAYVGSS